MNDVLFHSELAGREHGTDLLSVPELIRWADALGGQLRTEPDFRAFSCVQIEALLCAIERPFAALTLDEARELVSANPELASHKAADAAPKWLLGVSAHSQWRKAIECAIDAGDLVPLDFQSRLPKPSARIADEPESAGHERTQWADPDQLILAFGPSTGMSRAWFRKPGDTPKLKEAMRQPGKGGRGGHAALFCPYAVMSWLIDSTRGKGRPLTSNRGWQLLEGHFPRVYAKYSIGDPRDADSAG